MMRLICCVVLFAAVGCSSPAPPKPAAASAAPAAPTVVPLPPEFGRYWLQGKAELTSYDLRQARYGELHQGTAVLIFVTEDLSRAKQVKLDSPGAAPAGERVPVLKLNFDKKFLTGIYPYSVFTSTYTPLDAAANPHTLKTSTSVQEWCGHIFTQLNLRPEGGYAVSQKSYFESEGDRETSLPPTLLEDELWNRIRLNPSTLPTGRLRLLPGTVYSRLQHQPLTVREATATLGAAPANRRFGFPTPVLAYTLTYAGEPARTLAIYFGQAFPHHILGWDETYLDRAGAGAGRQLTSSAARRRTIQLDYWRTHTNSDAGWRDSLGLDHRLNG
ncbi:hypothetical protein [uncultured Hymenobacter sp.]|uniref:hypothetical protein n=1 Tax=uncultured Hymenobacter sp. TaxID=170016 RepID=UPI0035CC8EC2